MDNKIKVNREQSTFLEDTLYHFNGWFKRLWILILVFATIGASGIVGYTYLTYTPLYSASATFTVNVDVQESSADHYNKATAEQLSKTFPNILTSSSLNKIVCHDIGANYISETIKASVLEDTNLFTITVTSTNPQRAYNVLSSVITNYPEVAKFIIGSTQLTLIDTSSVSTKPINYPDYQKKAIIGTAAGIILALGIMLLLALMTSTVIRNSDITKYFNVKCLCSVPELTKKKRSNTDIKNSVPNIENKNINYKFRESIFKLRNSIVRIAKENEYKSFIVTSTISGEGKSIIALNLAMATAMKGYKTILIDFDLRVPSIYSYMNIENDSINSVTDCIKENKSWKNCVYATNTENFYIAVEKNNNSDANILLGSENAKQFIDNLKTVFDFIIIDSPPTSYLSDASIIGDYADAALYVIAQDVASRKTINDGLSSFDNINTKIIGAVLNRITKGVESLTYGKYSYRRYGYSGYNRYYGNKHLEENSDEIIPLTLKDNGVIFEDE